MITIQIIIIYNRQSGFYYSMEQIPMRGMVQEKVLWMKLVIMK